MTRSAARDRAVRVRPVVPVALVALLTVAAGVPAGTADAGAATVRVAAIDRSGRTSGIAASAVNLATGKVVGLDAGTGAALPTGRYAIGAYIGESPALTVATRTVTVSRSTTVTFDTRKAHKVTFDVGDAGVRPVDLAVVPFARAKGKEKAFIPAYTQKWPAADTYVLPDSATGVRLGIHGVLGTPGASGRVRYDLAYALEGMPSKVSFTTSRAKLARVELNVTTVDGDQNSWLGLTARQKNLSPVTGVKVGAPVLGRQTDYRTPNLQWGSVLAMNSLTGGSAFLEEGRKAGKLIYAAGKAYHEDWGLGVWAPRPTTPAIFAANGRLTVAGGPPICAFNGTGVTLTSCQLQPQSFSYTLSRAGKSLGTGEAITAAIDASTARWYTATMSATRNGTGDLASRVSARWYFQAGGTTREETPTAIIIHENRVLPGYIRILPKGADSRNRVAGGTPTTLTLTVQQFGKVAAMKVAYSTDGGKTWTPAKVTRKGGAFLAAVPAPSSGAVSLRATARGPSGASIALTAINAYGVKGA